MNTEQAILQTVHSLLPEQQQEVLDFAEFLKQKTETKKRQEAAEDPESDKSNIANQEKFKQLVAAWRTEQDPFSSIIDFEHPAYQAIIAMGSAAIPLILHELQEDPDYWFWALQEITKENPILPEQEGNLASMTATWLSWGQERGYLNR